MKRRRDVSPKLQGSEDERPLKMTPDDRKRREIATIEKNKDRLEGRKPGLDERVKGLQPLHDQIHDKLKSAFQAAKDVEAFDNEYFRDIADVGRGIFDEEMEEVHGLMITQYKPKRHALLADINGLNEDIRRYNREIETKRHQGQHLSNELKVDEYPSSKVPGDIEHFLTLQEVIDKKLWTQYEETSTDQTSPENP